MNPQRALLTELCVQQSERGAGYDTALIHRLAAVLRNSGVKRLTVVTSLVYAVEQDCDLCGALVREPLLAGCAGTEQHVLTVVLKDVREN